MRICRHMFELPVVVKMSEKKKMPWGLKGDGLKPGAKVYTLLILHL